MIRFSNSPFQFYRHFSNQARFWLLCSARRYSFRQRTKLPVRKSFRLHTKRPVESRAIIFPGHRRSQFHQLALGKFVPQRRKQFIGNFRWRSGERGGKSHYILFHFREIRAGFELRHAHQLLFRESLVFSAHGRMNVNSKRTSHQHRRFQHRKALQTRRQRPFRFRIHRHAHKLTQQPRVIRQNFRSLRNMPLLSFPKPVNQPHVPWRLFRLYSTDARHMNPPHFFVQLTTTELSFRARSRLPRARNLLSPMTNRKLLTGALQAGASLL